MMDNDDGTCALQVIAITNATRQHTPNVGSGDSLQSDFLHLLNLDYS